MPSRPANPAGQLAALMSPRIDTWLSQFLPYKSSRSKIAFNSFSSSHQGRPPLTPKSAHVRTHTSRSPTSPSMCPTSHQVVRCRPHRRPCRSSDHDGGRANIRPPPERSPVIRFFLEVFVRGRILYYTCGVYAPLRNCLLYTSPSPRD